MHIPDNFLSTPVWATMDGLSIPALGWMLRRAGRQVEESRIPLLGVMGAFVFAAQMVNFPVGIGTSAHLVGGALLALTLGPASASVVMAAILVIQALIFQDGGVLALGANVFNMAICGVLAGYLPYRVWGATRFRGAAIFIGAFLSVLISALLALLELGFSGIHLPKNGFYLSLALFAAGALIEGLITLAVVRSLERINHRWIQAPGPVNYRLLYVLAAATLLLASAGFTIASRAPDGIEKLGGTFGLPTTGLFPAPLSGYVLPALRNELWQKAAASMLGLVIIYFACLVIARLLSNRRGNA